MLASDLNNPQFAGATNPDANLFVQFYMAPRQLGNGFPIHPDFEKENPDWRTKKVPWVMIQKPGDATLVLREEVNEEHKKRWPEKWLYFQMQEGMIDGAKDMPGTPIESWPEVAEKLDWVHDLKAKRFYTVESIAAANDQQVQGIGMGGLGLREKAKQFLKGQMDAGVRAEIAKRDEEIAELRKMVMELVEKRGPGRPPKEKEAA